MKNIKTSIALIGVGISLGFSLIVYAHANFATKETLKLVKNNQLEHQVIIREDIKEIKTDIKEILKRIN